MSDGHVFVMDPDAVIKAAIEAKKFSYSPYSKFRVGAALLAADGIIIKGANVENASIGGTICAERTTIVKAVSEGTRSFLALAITSDLLSPVTPCGICRQVILEFCAPDMPIFLVPSDYPQDIMHDGREQSAIGYGGVKKTTIQELLPDSFGAEQLKLPRANDRSFTN